MFPAVATPAPRIETGIRILGEQGIADSPSRGGRQIGALNYTVLDTDSRPRLNVDNCGYRFLQPKPWFLLLLLNCQEEVLTKLEVIERKHIKLAAAGTAYPYGFRDFSLPVQV